MSCPVCDSEEAIRPAIPCGVEMWTCKSCGHMYGVHIQYVLEPWPGMMISVLFTGSYTLPSAQEATKSYLTLKRLLTGCERFSQHRLERQFIGKEPVWELGLFLDDEVERLLPECERLGLPIEFRVYSEDN